MVSAQFILEMCIAA